MSSNNSYARQIHLDFHTSELIGDVAADFDPDAFAQQMQDAHVNSVTVFAKCHHGQCYYPTKTGVQHPALNGRDMLGEQLEALKKRGIRCPLYTTVVWEEDAAYKHPEWRQLKKNGSFAEWRMATDRVTEQAGFWKFNDFHHPEYQDYFEAHIRELLDLYDVDGFFVDILFFHEEGTWSEPVRKLRQELGIWDDSEGSNARIEWEAQRRFIEKFNAIAQGIQPKAEMFYNQHNRSFIDHKVGFGSMSKIQSQLEVESLPSGFWGYQHFPRLARETFDMGKNWLGMTGRFQRQWGDFGGVKPVPALEYECFRAQAMGGWCSVGDQLPPRGVLDKAAYRLIGEVYGQIEEAEPFYEGTENMPNVAILQPGHPNVPGDQSNQTLEGVILMCEEAHYDCVVVNDEVEDLRKYDLVILPDSLVVTELLKPKLDAYLASGGKMILSHNSGSDESGEFYFTKHGVTPSGVTLDFPTYWRLGESFDDELRGSDRVVYNEGNEYSFSDEWKVLIERIPPYFRRMDNQFCSHFQTPPQSEPSDYPAVVSNGQIVVFTDPVFREYRKYGTVLLRQVWEQVMTDLIGKPAIGAGLPSSVVAYPRKFGQQTRLTLLHYIPVRKALEIDVIEQRHSFAGMELIVPESVTSVKDWETGETLSRNDSGAFVLPMKAGRLLLELE